LSFANLVATGLVEFLDIEEEESAMISMDLKSLENSTYC
jgi:hypothetical protein